MSFDPVATFELQLVGVPRGTGVLVLPLLLEARRSIIVAPGADREAPQKGIVVSVGPRCEDTALGQLVSYGQHAGLRIDVIAKTGTVPLYLLREAEILLAAPAGSYGVIVHDDDARKVHEDTLTCEACDAPTTGDRPGSVADANAPAGADTVELETPGGFLAGERERQRNLRRQAGEGAPRLTLSNEPTPHERSSQ
jgi:hypothetical protein